MIYVGLYLGVMGDQRSLNDNSFVFDFFFPRQDALLNNMGTGGHS